ncbi:type I restriction-modification system subunit M [Adlercreutzia sp. ZJ141]|uniref:type I restriction-modification system subunit M n=1 Tax=Adlercreutzia sp. ZJ141 TaxID=2709406 RepID=UPI0013EC4034|nr:class I SAM-dependent DNA methyltransferase [Adlercreutzia sp. ZJ141]
MNHSAISSFIWGTADLLRSSFKQHEYGDIILPFTVLRRLDVVLAPTKQVVLAEAAKPLPDFMAAMGEDDRRAYRDRQLKIASGLDFYNTSNFTMESLLDEEADIKENITTYIAAFSPEIVDILENFKIYDVIKDLDQANLLYLVTKRFCDPRVDLSPESVTNADMGDIYEELIRKFSEVSNETAGEHFSPRDGLALAADLLIAGAKDDLTVPNRIVKVCDPCAGTGGAIAVFEDRMRALNPRAEIIGYGQEINPQSYAICKSDTILKGGKSDNIHFGDTLANDTMVDELFGYQISNPPYGVEWKKSREEVKDEHEKKGFAGRFGAGLPRISDGQLLFVQHMVSKMRLPEDGGGRIAVFLNGSPLFTGAAGSGESEIRRFLLERDLVEAIVAMPNDFFFNTGIATYIWVITNAKASERKGKVQLINANGIFSKMRKSLGSKRKQFTDEQIEHIVGLYNAFEEADPKLSKVFTNDDFGYTTVTVERPLRDDDGAIVIDKKGKPKPDSSLRDNENIPLGQDIQQYFEREVLPYAPDAWMDRKKDKVGYEIPFTRYFYEYTPLRPSQEILGEIRELEASIAEQLQKAGF